MSASSKQDPNLSGAAFSQKPVIAIVGSTATGKTALGVELAHALQTEVVSADSQVIYRELTIGTAKPSLEEQQGIPHHMIDCAAPDEIFSAAAYQETAEAHLERLWALGKVPVVVGGTGFYIRALLEAEFIPEVPPDSVFREHMQQRLRQEGSPALHHELSVKDPRRAADLHPNDGVRIIRALEIINATGSPVPQRNQKKPLSITWFGLTYNDRVRLDARIDQRIATMLDAGWLNEVAQLIQRYGPEAHALQVAHGYPELVNVLQGHCTLAEAVAQIQINIHQYARRQMTWFRRNPDIHWLECDTMPWSSLCEAAMARLPKACL